MGRKDTVVSGDRLRELSALILAMVAPEPATIGPRFTVAADLGGLPRPGRSPDGRVRLEKSLETGLDATQTMHTAVVDDDTDDDIDDEHVETWRLVTQAQNGDGQAFGQLYDRYVDTVYRYIYFRVNDRGLAEDFTSETFLRALRRISSITYQGRDIGAWFITIARNIVLDHIKSARYRLEVTTSDTLEGKEVAPSPEASVLDSFTTSHLMAAVKRLGDDQRECITLRFVHGLSVAETAEAMGKNDGAIKALQHRAVRKLAELVGDSLR